MTVMLASSSRLSFQGPRLPGSAASCASVMGALALVTITYLLTVYGVKQWFFKRYQMG